MTASITPCKSDVARSFDRAAHTYDNAARLQRQVARRLNDFLLRGSASQSSAGPSSASYCADLGCGTGYFTQLMSAHEPESLTGIDIAPSMLSLARNSVQYDGISWCCADAENLPLADNSLTLLGSSLALQWCPDLQQVFTEAHRVLQPDGRFVFSTLGPTSLYQLKQAWALISPGVHVNHFIARDELESMAERAGMPIEIVEEEIVLEYGQLVELTRELKALGAHNINPGRPKGLTGKRQIRRLLANYEAFRNDRGMLPATYQVFYAVAVKPSGC